MSGLKVYYVNFYTYWVLLITNMLGMHKSNEGLGCNSLLENTTVVLSEETIQMLFVSAHETNLALCIKYAAKKCVITKSLMCIEEDQSNTV